MKDLGAAAFLQMGKHLFLCYNSGIKEVCKCPCKNGIYLMMK